MRRRLPATQPAVPISNPATSSADGKNRGGESSSRSEPALLTPTYVNVKYIYILTKERVAMAQVVQTLDDFGRPAWIVAMVLGFVLFWPVGLIILAYMLWSGRMNCGWHHGGGRRWESRFAERFDRARSRVEGEMRNFTRGTYLSGNRGV